MLIRSSHQNIRDLVVSLAPGTRVIWIANGTKGTIQPDKTILWDNGHRMGWQQMRDHHALLIHSETEKRRLQDALNKRLQCLKRGCNLVHWDDDGYEGYKQQFPERLCPLAAISEPEPQPTPEPVRPHRERTRPSHSPQPSADAA